MLHCIAIAGVMELGGPNPSPQPSLNLHCPTQHNPSQCNSGVSASSDTGSDAVIISRTDAFKPLPIENSTLCVQESSANKKLPSLTNEGKSETFSLAGCIGVCVSVGGRLVGSRLLVEGKDFVLLPEAIWKVFVSWYCSSAYISIPALPRTVRHYCACKCCLCL